MGYCNQTLACNVFVFGTEVCVCVWTVTSSSELLTLPQQFILTDLFEDFVIMGIGLGELKKQKQMKTERTVSYSRRMK